MESYTITCFIENSESDLDKIEDQINNTGELSYNDQQQVLKYVEKLRDQINTFKDNIEEIEDEEEDEE